MQTTFHCGFPLLCICGTCFIDGVMCTRTALTMRQNELVAVVAVAQSVEVSEAQDLEAEGAV